MKKQVIIIWVLLMLLTIIAGLASMISMKFMLILILILSTIKFLGVFFDFMDMKRSNVFWKTIMITYLVLLNSIIVFLLY